MSGFECKACGTVIDTEEAHRTALIAIRLPEVSREETRIIPICAQCRKGARVTIVFNELVPNDFFFSAEKTKGLDS